LNLPFRDPLVPLAPTDRAEAKPASLQSSNSKTVRFHHGDLAPRAEDVRWLTEIGRRFECGVIACGPMDAAPDLANGIAKLAAKLSWPILADAASQLRSGPHTEGAPILAASDLFLRDPGVAASLAPDVVLRFGASATSKALRLWIEKHEPAHLVLVDPSAQWNDPGHQATEFFCVDPLALCDALAKEEPAAPKRSGGWLETFVRAERSAACVLERAVDDEDELLEPRAVRELAAVVPDNALLYVSNSMPVRDLDAFLPVSNRPLRVLANRGANGIDGMLSSALGAAAGQPQPVVLLTGDLAFLHDIGALLAARRNGIDLTVVVFDNNGGGIFSFLPVADYAATEVFEKHFRTPHGIELGPVSEAFGASMSRATSWEHFRASVKDAIATPGVSIIEVGIDRDRSVAHHREIDRAVSEAIAREGEGS
jgi:2-succinyl-5-enolpyruvyl-6-hydroxy-3-cyclohexene-1-carboxylate synthase